MSAFVPWWGVFETLRVSNGRALFEAHHREELLRAVEALGLKLRASKIGKPPAKKSGRWRWVVTAEGTSSLFTPETFTSPSPITLAVAPMRVGSHNWDARFKTVSYLTHAQARQEVNADEAVLLNERGDVASAAQANIFWRRGDTLFTPAHATGCRCGIVRRFVMERRDVLEDQLGLPELLAADEIFVTNSLRGIVSVRAIEGAELTEHPTADALRREYEAEVARQLAA